MLRVRLLHVFLLAIILLFCFLPFFSDGRLYVFEDKKQLKMAETKKEKWECVACTFVIGLISQLKQLHHISASEALRMFCYFLGTFDSRVCRIFSFVFLRGVLRLIDDNKTADVVCQTVAYCKNEQCHLFPRPDNELDVDLLRRIYQLENVKKMNICALFSWFCNDNSPLKPLIDVDGDLFSSYSNRRGSDWRGRDCDDVKSTVYPGRNTTDESEDQNCNGIYGVDKVTGKSYEELWCSNSSPMGVIALGDSVTAHFGIPADFVTVRNLSRDAFAHLKSIMLNEFDWPMISSTTGFANTSTYSPNKSGPMKSMYSELLKINRCNHRDYQNLGVNGATTAELSKMMDYVARNRSKFVKPTFLFLSMIGNDVCGDLDSKTTPEKYYTHLTEALEKAEKLLPAGSHVLIVPVADGRVLYDTLHNRTHPIGSLNNDVTYSDFYDYLNCVNVSPCTGWLNTNKTMREASWKAAQLLNAQIPRVLRESAKKFKYIKVHALDDIITAVIKKYDPSSVWELVEPVDGFHPSQLGAALLGEYIFNKTAELGILPPVNPFNDAIQERFGDQGGY